MIIKTPVLSLNMYFFTQFVGYILKTILSLSNPKA
jgi:hypothetical protein